MPVDKFGRSRRITPLAHHTQPINKSEDLLLNIGTDNNRSLGCTDLTDNKSFTLNLGDNDNKIMHTKGREVKILTSDGLEISKANYNGSFKFNVEHRNELDGFSVRNLPNPTNDSDAATMGYVKQMAGIQHTVVEGTIPNAPYTHIVMMKFQQQPPPLINVYIEVDTNEWLDVTCARFADIYKNFSLYIKENSLFCYFSAAPGLWFTRRFKIIYL